MPKKFYITTSIAYVNARPHIGFAMELIQADVLARYHRMIGDDTFSLTGTDEHGMKLETAAKEQGMEPQQLVDMNAAYFKELKEVLNLSYDHFIRTTDDYHEKGAQKVWTLMNEKGDIYKDSYEGLYCIGCEAFVLEKDLVDGKCPNHNRVPEKLREENYFFKLSKYSEEIGKKIESGELKIFPESKKNEILFVIKEGLKDVSFSRPKKILKWGIDVPNDPDQVMYVWCDALSNYITGVGYGHDEEKFKRFWPADVHLIGKDILRFHSAIWIGMLMSAGIELPKAIYVHGFITSEGKKMSKSLNNVVDPNEYVNKYSADALRYFLLKEIPTVDDGDFSVERFKVVYGTELANNIGNLVSRVLAMTGKYFEGKVPEASKSEDILGPEVVKVWKEYQDAISVFDLKKALEIVAAFASYANKFVDDTKPWALAKEENTQDLARVIYALLEMIRHLSLLLLPFLPLTSAKISGYLGEKTENIDFAKAILWGGLQFGQPVQKADPLFARVEEEQK
jgi:methionyl-tRNA synthetase